MNARSRAWKKRHVRPHDAARIQHRLMRRVTKQANENIRKARRAARGCSVPPFDIRAIVLHRTALDLPCVQRCNSFNPCTGEQTLAAVRAVEEGTATDEQRRIADYARRARDAVGLPPLTSVPGLLVSADGEASKFFPSAGAAIVKLARMRSRCGRDVKRSTGQAHRRRLWRWISRRRNSASRLRSRS